MTKRWTGLRNLCTRYVPIAEVKHSVQSHGGCHILFQIWQHGGDVTSVEVPQQKHRLLAGPGDSAVIEVCYSVCCQVVVRSRNILQYHRHLCELPGQIMWSEGHS